MPSFDQPLPPETAPEFATSLLQALARLPPQALGLEQGLRYGNAVSDQPTEWMWIGQDNSADKTCYRLGVFFLSSIAGCACSGDPTPADTLQEFCEVRLTLEPDRVNFTLHFE